MFYAQQNSRVSWCFLALICGAAFTFMANATLQEAAIVDEAAHIPAGYAYVQEQDFRLNPEHPPLVKALSALPLLILQPNFPTNIAAWTTDLNGQWAMGEAFLYNAGNNARTLVTVSRLMPILLTLLTIIFIYFWSRQLLGNAWALLPAFLFALSPTVLAHGHYVTTDIGAAFGILVATYFFIKFLRAPSRSNILFAGAALGIAQLMKFSAVLLFPYLVLLALIHFLVNASGLRGKYFWQTALKKLGQLVAVFIIAFVVIWAVYAVLTANYPIDRQVADTEQTLPYFLSSAATNGACSLTCRLAEATVWMAGNPALRPLAEYFLGVLMVLQRSEGGNTAYFLGEVSKTGSHWYFPGVYLLKESLPALIIIAGALLAALWRMARTLMDRKQAWAKFTAYLRNHFTEFALFLFLAIYWIQSVRSTLNIGVRHLMPVIPIAYMLAAGPCRQWISWQRINLKAPLLDVIWNALKSFFTSWLKFSILCALLLWVLFETFAAAPHFLSYFNQIGGGKWYGYRYVTDSNYDWGQDMLRLRQFLDEHPEIDKIALDYFGTAGAPAYYLGDRKVDWWSAKGNPKAAGINWLAVSLNPLQSAIQPADHDFSLSRKPQDTYNWLTALRPAPAGLGQVPEPDYRVGTSIFIYKL